MGKGASFIFTFRAEIGAAGTQALTADVPVKEAPGVPGTPGVPGVPSTPGALSGVNESVNYRGKRILLAEDIDINREIVINLLEPLGLEITQAEDGQKAYDLFRADPDSFDLIFMDIHMPGVDGYESTKLIRVFEAERNKKNSEDGNNSNLRGQIPIIAMTANVFREDIEHCYAAGMNGHIGKPLDFDAVIAILKKYLTLHD
jgi:FOG: CheY-like receiver